MYLKPQLFHNFSGINDTINPDTPSCPLLSKDNSTICKQKTIGFLFRAITRNPVVSIRALT